MKARITILLLMLAALFCSAAFAQEQQKTVAVVVPFDSSGVPQEEVDVVYRMFLSEFVRTGKCSVVDRSSFDKIKALQNFQLSDWSNNDKVAKLGKALNANVVVTGQAMKFRTQVMFIVQILDVNSTEIISSADEQVSDVAVLFSRFNEMCKVLTKNLVRTQNAMSEDYKIGDKGPGGGWIFYVSEEGFPVYKGNSMVTCHYLECSPTSLGTAKWCSHHLTCNIENRNGVGTGFENTIKILSKHSGISASQCAAKLCNLYYTDTTKQGTWYLPSQYELELIVKNIVGKRIGTFRESYWSSSLNDYKRPCYYFYNIDYRRYTGAATEPKWRYCVFAVRAF